jgi:chromosome segregation ATPase
MSSTSSPDRIISQAQATWQNLKKELDKDGHVDERAIEEFESYFETLVNLVETYMPAGVR